MGEVATEAPAAEGTPGEEPAPVDAVAEEEEDGPLEDWTRKELAEECKTLGLSDKGVKAVLIARIKEAREAKVAETPAEEVATEEAAVEEAVVDETPAGEAAVEEAPVEEAVGEEALSEETATEETQEVEAPAVEAEEPTPFEAMEVG